MPRSGVAWIPAGAIGDMPSGYQGGRRQALRRRPGKLLEILCAATFLLLALPLGAAGSERSLTHYTHRSWSEESNAPRPVYALAQGKRGYLWVASGTGLYRFDGVNFELISGGIDRLAHGPPSALLVRSNGDVWTNFERSRRFAVYRDGKLNFLKAPVAPDRVQAMEEGPDGTIWALTEAIGAPLLRYRAGRWTLFGRDAGAPIDNPFSMVVTSGGTVWVSFTGSVARLAPGSERFETVMELPRSLGRLSIDPEERIWLTERRGSYPITGPKGRGEPPALRNPYRTDAAEIRGWPLFDREGNLWIATYYDGLQRVRRPDPRGELTSAGALGRVEHFEFSDGLSSNVTTRILQAADGDIWVGTENGVDRFGPATLRFEPELSDPAAFGDLLLQARDGTVYIGEASTVYRVLPGGRPEAIYRTDIEPRTLCEAPDGAIWIGIDRKIVIWRNGNAIRLEQPAPVSSTIYDCAFDANGDYWVTAALGGMARLKSGRWERMFGEPGNGFLPKSMTSNDKGTIIFQWNDSRLSLIDRPRPELLPIPVGGYEPDEVALYAAGGNILYLGGRFGLARFQDGKAKRISPRRVPRFNGINGIVQTPEGDTWLAGAGGLMRLRTAALEAAFEQPDRPLAIQSFGTADGLRSMPHDHSRHSIVRGGDGRLWIATQTGTLWLDPREIARTSHPPRVAIRALFADRLYRDPVEVTLPAGTRDIEIDFAVFAFSSPREAKVRYRIEGQDAEWVEAGMRRQAFYTNLSPGTYRFELAAAGEDGPWSEEPAVLEFTIPPTFVQSGWFIGICALAIILLLGLLYRLRMASVAARIRSRLAERLGERERIARELHDTLLQSVQGLVLRFQSVANRMPQGGESRAQLEDALKRADEVIAEGRSRVQELRAADGPGDLAELIRQRAVEADFDPATSVRIVVEGKQRPLHPLVSAELGRIAGEALLNVARHASANRVEVSLRYGARDLVLEIVDDGVGIAADFLDRAGRPGHFGLVGMRERAERIGAAFSIESEADGGSAVGVTLASALAYAGARPARRLPWTFKRKEKPGRA